MHQSTLKLFKRVRIFWDESRNVRGPWEYDTAPDPRYKPGEGGKAGLFEDIRENGLQTELWISIPDPERLARIRVQANDPLIDAIGVRGHRRARVLAEIARIQTDRFDMIPCKVYTGLTETDERLLLCDQSHTKALSEWGQYLSIKQLRFAGLSEDTIGTRIGKSRGFVQARCRIMAMASVVEDAYRAKCEGKPTVNVSDPNLVALHKAHTLDVESGIREPEGGPAFHEAWSALVAKGTAVEPKVTPQTREQMLSMMMQAKDPVIVGTLRWAAGEPVGLDGPIAMMATLREKALFWEQHLLNLATSPEATSPEATSPEATSPEATSPEATSPEATANIPFEPEPIVNGRKAGKQPATSRKRR